MGTPGPFEELREKLADRYTILEEIGRGGMAVVFKAHDLKHGRDVAIKVLRQELSVALGAERFSREIRIEAQLQHPNILALFDSGQVGGWLYYVMPLADGGTLADRLRKEGVLGAEEALGIIREIGDALAYAHRQGVVHRDVKPDNILFSSGHATIADFGIAQAIADVAPETLTATGVAIGTPWYMSPEQAGAAGPVDGRSDQYSLACVLFEMLAGEPPFTGRTPQAVVARHMQERPPSLEVVRPDIPPHIALVIAKGLAKVPADRFRSIEEMVAALSDASGRVAHDASRRPRWLLVSVVTLAVTGGGTGWWWAAHRDRPALSSNRIAVFPLATRDLPSSEADAGTSVAYLIEAALEHADPLQFIDVTGHLDEDQLRNSELVSARTARGIGRRQRAAWYLRGVVQGHGDSTTVLLRLFDVVGDSLVDQSSASGPFATSPLHHLAIDALKELLPAMIDPARTVDLTPLRNRRANAVALWLQGERHYRHSDFERALDLYERALQEDSSLALAAVKGAAAATWLHDDARGRLLVNLALSMDSLLPDRYIALAHGWGDYFRSDADSAVASFAHALAINPEWAEAYAGLGEVYYHLLPRAAPLDSLAEAAFDRSLASDSGFAPPLFHLIEASVGRGDLHRADALLGLFRKANPNPGLVRQLTVMYDCVRDPGRMDWPSVVRTTSVGLAGAGKSLATGGRQPECAEAVFRAVLEGPFTSAEERWGAFMGLQGLLVALGRDREARVLIDSVVASGKGAARTLYVLDAVAGAAMEAPAAELDQYARAAYGNDYERTTRAEQPWVLAVWHQYRGNTERMPALERVVELRARASGSERDRILAYSVRAGATLARGDTATAIDLLRALPSQGTGAEIAWGFADALAPDRLLLARLLLAGGLYDESVRAASVFDHPGPVTFLAYVPLSLAIRYEAARAAGNHQAAETFRARLRRLHRADLVGEPNPTTGGN